MKTKKDLAKYLANYLEQEKLNFTSADTFYDSIIVEIGVDDLQKILEQGLEAFESTETVEVLIVSEEIAHSIKDMIEQSREIDDES